MDISAWPLYGWGAFWFKARRAVGKPLLYYILFSIGTVFLALSSYRRTRRSFALPPLPTDRFHTYDFAWVRHTGRFGTWVPTTPPGFYLIWIIRSFVTLAFFRAAIFRAAMHCRAATLRLMWVALRLADCLPPLTC